jgi:signal-transduction protein with cAMP-binding, CBS, and nucleotidyltransferase domain
LVTPLGPHPDQPSIDKYRINIPVTSPAEADGTVSTMTYRTWYAAQRVGLHLNNVKHGGKKNTADIAERLQSVVTGLGLGPEAYATMSANARLLQFAEGETVQHRNTIPAAVGFITEGRVEMLVQADDGRQVRLGTLGIGDYLGATAVTRQRGIVAMVALTDVAIVAVPWEAMEQVVRTDHRFARQIGDTIDMRRNAAKEALAQAAQTAIG